MDGQPHSAQVSVLTRAWYLSGVGHETILMKVNAVYGDFWITDSLGVIALEQFSLVSSSHIVLMRTIFNAAQVPKFSKHGRLSKPPCTPNHTALG
jgi:hypothetical protein